MTRRRRPQKLSTGMPREARPSQAIPLYPRTEDATEALSNTSYKVEMVHFDRTLFGITLALIGVGLVFVFSASARQAAMDDGDLMGIVVRQAVSVAIGLAFMLWLSRVNFKSLRKIAYPLTMVTIFLLIYTMFAGSTANGSERWLSIAGFRFQPSELAKLSAVILLAKNLSGRKLNYKNIFMVAILIGSMILLIYQQPNLSIAILLTLLLIMMLFIGGVSIWAFLVSIPPIIFKVSQKIAETPYQMARIQGWLDPWAYPQTAGYNLIQSYYAIGSGGVFGRGLGASLQKLFYLPFQHTDFIFAVICEELGLFGSLLIVSLYGLLAWRGFSIAYYCASRFGQMLAFGITSVIVMQAIINICVTIGLMPVTGVTLPLISYGGTSVVVTLAMVGVLLNISRFRLIWNEEN
ncbi:MAG: putative lipid II flippase FtsW [Candidatus Melainabacteria bacterium]|nr:putative lipid II flippase FtsW [Candidatus Melainabacteria bacterium]